MDEDTDQEVGKGEVNIVRWKETAQHRRKMGGNKGNGHTSPMYRLSHSGVNWGLLTLNMVALTL